VTRKLRPVVALTVFIMALVALPAWAASPSWRVSPVTRGLDYLHGKQRAGGGFGLSTASDPTMTPWVVLAIAAAHQDPGAWKVGTSSALTALQSTDIESVAKGSALGANAPRTYARYILAYVAGGRLDIVTNGVAGAQRIDLVGKLYAYQDLVAPSADGHFSPMVSGDRSAEAIDTTAWALLALRAVGEQGNANFALARSWLTSAQNSDGGWGSQAGSASSVAETSLAIQALLYAGVSDQDGSIVQGLSFLRAMQRADGGFPSSATDTRTYAEATAWAIEAIRAAAQDPASSAWSKGSANPVIALSALQPTPGPGYFLIRSGVTGAPLSTAAQSVIALSGAWLPVSHQSTVDAVSFRPVIKTAKPKNAYRTTTSSVYISASYADAAGGTGVNYHTVRLLVDGVSRTSKAHVTSTGLHIALTHVPNGSHTWQVIVADRAGNSTTLTRKFTVAVPVHTSPGSGSGGTVTPVTPTHPVTPVPTPSYPVTPVPTTTLSPTPTTTPGGTTPSPSASGGITGTPLSPNPQASQLPSQTPLPSASASVSGQATGIDSGGKGGGLTSGLLGGGLAALLPIGALFSYIAHRRQAGMLASAGAGKMLGGGGTPWAHFKTRLYSLPKTISLPRR
jgi:hypothetical protein